MSVKEIFVVMTFSVMAWKSLGLKWATEGLHTSCCEGEDKILIWNYSLEQNEIVEDIQWYFNQWTQIAYESEYVKFLVSPFYKGRVERIGQMDILLKNVSSVDTGNYSLYLNLGPESPEITQTIFLTVFGAPRYQCKPSITKYSENVLFCSTNSCGGMQLSTEWRIFENNDFLSDESYLKINSSLNDELVSCCLHRQYMQCQNGNLLDFCASTFIYFAEAPDSRYTENIVNLTPAVIVLTTLYFLSIVVSYFIYRKKICRLCANRCKNTDKVRKPNNEPETCSMIEGTKQFRDTDKVQKPNAVPKNRPLRDSELHMNVILEPVCIKEHEAHSTIGGAKRCKDTDKVQEPNNEPETRFMIEDTPADFPWTINFRSAGRPQSK